MGQVAVGQWAWRVKPAVCMCGTVAGEAAAVDLAAALPDVRALLALVPLVWVAAARARVPAGALCLGADGAAATARMAPAAVAAARAASCSDLGWVMPPRRPGEAQLPRAFWV
jgi:hypothetical protein